jgi:hypothetical protein
MSFLPSKDPLLAIKAAILAMPLALLWLAPDGVSPRLAVGLFNKVMLFPLPLS